MSRDVCGICWCPYDDDGKCGCKPAQPEALRLIQRLEQMMTDGWATQSEADAAAELRRLHAENEALQKALRRVIRTYMVADEVWNPEAELERMYQWVIKE